MDRMNAPHRLLVEGTDDFHTIIHLLKRHYPDWDTGPTKDVCVVDCESYTRLLEALESEIPVLRQGGRIGIVVDADTDPKGRWDSITGKLQSVGVNLPDSAGPGTVFFDLPEQAKRLGIWLMPDNSNPGALEHFLEKLIPESQKNLWDHACEATGVAADQKAPFWCTKNDNIRKKAEIHTWLAWQENPGQPFGTALTSKVFGHESKEATQFLAWFGRLFLDARGDTSAKKSQACPGPGEDTKTRHPF